MGDEDGDEVYFDYVDDESTRRFRLLQVPEDMSQEIKLEDESTDESTKIPFKWLKNYFENPAENLGEDTRLDIKIEPGFDFSGINPSAEKDDPFGEQLISKLKPVIKEMMRGNYG